MRNKYSSSQLFLLSLSMILIIILPVIVLHSGNLYLVGDYMSQQIPFIRESRRLILSGKPFWSANSFLGANFLGTYSFYNWASPFYWPLFLLPESLTGVGLSITFALKHIIAALTSHLYLKKHTKISHLAFVGALIYTFSFFTIDSTYFFHFIDVIAVFPLIPYLVDEVLENRKKCLLSLTVLLNGMINYYFLVSTSVFFLIYLFFRIKFSDKKYTFKDALRCIIFYALGGFSSMFVLLPSLLSLLETNKATGSFTSSLIRGLGTVPQLLKILKGIVLPSEGILGSATGFNFSNFNSNSGFLPFFGAVFLFIAISKKSDKWYFRLIKFLFILTVIPFGNGIFSFFTNMSYTRWWYAFVLIGTLASIKVIEEQPQKEELRKSAKTVFLVSAIVIGIPLILKITCAYLFPEVLNILPEGATSYLSSAGLTKKFTSEDFRYAVVFLLLTSINYIPLYFSVKSKRIFSHRVIPIVAVICVASYGIYLSNEANVCDNNQKYKGNDISVTEECIYTHRTEYDYSFANYPQIANEPGISNFISFKSHSTAKFCNLTGYENTLHLNSKKYFTTPAIQAVLSIKTLVDENGNRTDAPYYTPFGFTYDYFVIDENYGYTTNIKENNRRIEIMTKACFVDRETAEKLDGILRPLKGSFNWKEEHKKTGAENFILTTSGFTATSTGEKERLVFFSIPHDNGWTAFINGKETEILTINGGLMGIIVPEGECEIEFRFFTPGLKTGITVSLITLTFLAGYSIYELIKKQRRFN